MEIPLISMRKFILANRASEEELGYVENIERIYKDNLSYARFLTTQLSIGIFIPTDKEGNVLEKPKDRCLDYDNITTDEFILIQEQYEEALEKVLFHGVEMKGLEHIKFGSYEIDICNGFRLYLITGEALEDYIVVKQEMHTIEDLTSLGLKTKWR